jgi:hypothetical protein
LAVGGALVVLVGCDGPAKHADAQLQRLARVPALHVPPPGGRLLGTGVDRGSNSSVTGRPPETDAVFISSMDVLEIQEYYEHTYPQYRLSADFSAAPLTHIELVGRVGVVGRPGWFSVGMRIDDHAPDVGPHVEIHLPTSLPRQKTYIVVFAQGTTF